MSHLSLTQILYICNYWVLKQPVRAAAAETENSLVSTVQWYQYCRDIESWKIEKITSLLGGEDVIMHLDETVMLKKKYNRGRQRANNIWVIGLYDTSLRKGFVERIGDRKATTLIPIITRLVKRGSIIHTDEWKGYNSPSSLGYSHHRVNHSNDFVDPVAGTHTNSIEGFWGRLKNRVRAINGSRKDLIYSHLDEYIYTYIYRVWCDFSIDSPLLNWEMFLSHVRERYPL
ncbi:unnamed protein product [Trichobilharzia szidati]|nr:unnamed protein product [Trichobilharzia szidati]